MKVIIQGHSINLSFTFNVSEKSKLLYYAVILSNTSSSNYAIGPIGLALFLATWAAAANNVSLTKEARHRHVDKKRSLARFKADVSLAFKVSGLQFVTVKAS